LEEQSLSAVDPVHHDFSNSSVGRLAREEETFDLARSVESGSSSFLVLLEKEVGMSPEGSNIIAGPQEAMQSITKPENVNRTASDCSNFGLHELDYMKSDCSDIALKIGGMDLPVPSSDDVMKVPMPAWADAAGGVTKAMDTEEVDCVQ
jgi:hypothetical protein